MSVLILMFVSIWGGPEGGMEVEVAYITRVFFAYSIGSGGWPFMEPVIPWVPNPFKEAAMESPHDIMSNRRIDFKKKKKSSA